MWDFFFAFCNFKSFFNGFLAKGYHRDTIYAPYYSSHTILRNIKVMMYQIVLYLKFQLENHSMIIEFGEQKSDMTFLLQWIESTE